MYIIYTLFKVVSKTKTFHWVRGGLALTPSKAIPPLLAGTQTCFWVQNDLSWQSHPTQQLDDLLHPDLDVFNLVLVRLCQTWHTSAVCLFPMEKWSQLSSAHTIWAGRKLIQVRIVLGWRTDSCTAMAPVWEDPSWQASCHAFYLRRLPVIRIPERNSQLASQRVKAQDYRILVMECSKESHAVAGRWKGNKQALSCSERKWGSDPGQEVSPPVL